LFDPAFVKARARWRMLVSSSQARARTGLSLAEWRDLPAEFTDLAVQFDRVEREVSR
jgi:hypothetical protein